MATNHDMRQGVYEGILTIFFKAAEAMEPGDLLAFDANGDVVKAAAGDVPVGFAAQRVTTNGVADYEPGGLVSHTAKIGDTVGVYLNGGIYWANGTGFAVGDLLYPDTAGRLTKVAGADAAVALCIQASADGKYKFKALI